MTQLLREILLGLGTLVVLASATCAAFVIAVDVKARLERRRQDRQLIEQEIQESARRARRVRA